MVTIGGPVLGGALGDAGLWRFIFFMNIPIGVVTLLLLWKKVKEVKGDDNDKKLDIAGAFTIAAGLALLTFGLLRIPAIGFYSSEVLISLAAGLLFLIVFIWLEKRSKHPMMPLNLFSNMTFSGVNLLTFFLYAGLGTGMLFLGLNLVQVQGYSQLQSGLTFLPFTLLMIILARYAGALADKHGPRIFLIAGPAIAGAGLLLLAFVKQTEGPKDYWITFFPGILIFGFGMSITVSPLTAAVMGAVSDRFSGTASGINNAITRISNVFANAIFGTLAVLLFATSLKGQLEKSDLSAIQKQHVMAQANNLGNAKVPEGITDQRKEVIEQEYHESFISAYSYIMFLASGLCFAGALMSVLFIKNHVIIKAKAE
jgi:MFS family permease